MQETGVVISVEGMHAKVSVQRGGPCEGCKAGTCQVTEAGVTMEAVNTARAKVGQRVRVTLLPYTYFKGSLLLLGVPALMLILGAVAGKEILAPRLPASDPEGVSALTAFGLSALSFFIVQALSKRADRNVRYKPVIEEILSD